MPPMTPIGTFAFFWWFDHLGAVGVVLWAFSAFGDLLEDRKRTSLDWFMYAFMPLLFWSAPVVSPHLGIDPRVLVVTRPSPKGTYVMLLATFSLLLCLAYSPKAVLRVYLTGVGAGLIHHAALFFHGMRGYSSLWTLFATLATEWPALIVGVFACTAALRRFSWPSWGVCGGLASVAAIALAASLSSVDVEACVADLLPFIPGEWM